jgi:uncharacterized protein YjbI with pentapeptide repeats
MDANLRHASLQDCNLSHANIGGTILRSANVRGANFQGVELATVTMDFANFSQATNADIPSYKENLR